MALTIKDVAEEAGVTVTTVSRVLNNRGYISDKTRKKVHKAMKDLDYQPNAIARALVNKNTNYIGIIVPSLLHPFFSTCINYFEKFASQLGYKVMICNSQHNYEKELEYINLLKSSKVAGIIICTRSGGLDEHMKNLPVVSLERVVSNSIPAVTCDNYKGGELATRELINKGCSHIAIIGGSRHINLPADERGRAFLDVCKEKNLHPYFCQTKERQFDDRNYREEIEEIFDKYPDIDGIFASSDIIAAQVLQICKRRDIKVPLDIKVIGFDDIEIASLTIPELTTIHQPIDDMCQFAIEILDKKIRGENVPIRTILPVSLIKRNST